MITVGQVVQVVGGRKIPVGTTGRVSRICPSKFQPFKTRCCIQLDNGTEQWEDEENLAPATALAGGNRPDAQGNRASILVEEIESKIVELRGLINQRSGQPSFNKVRS
ncbi:MAG: hypothetical protein WBG01_10860 [Bacteroidota bacterium]